MEAELVKKLTSEQQRELAEFKEMKQTRIDEGLELPTWRKILNSIGEWVLIVATAIGSVVAAIFMAIFKAAKFIGTWFKKLPWKGIGEGLLSLVNDKQVIIIAALIVLGFCLYFLPWILKALLILVGAQVYRGVPWDMFGENND